MVVAAYVKDPDEVLEYPIDWSGPNGLDPGDTILTSTWTVPTGITKQSDSKTTTATLVWLTGGTNGVEYLCVNHITTAQGRQFDKTLIILVIEK